ncbi:MAG TPA: hypothetical protein VL551_34500 [Actinospica sp.]|nr:hypothetical protein [Actinospica sp.]
MSDIQVRVRPDHGAVAVFTALWRLVGNGEHENCPVVAADELAAEISAGAVRISLNEQQIRVMAAFHEAGHGVCYRILGVPVARVDLAGPEHGASGRTRYPDGADGQYLPYWVAGHLAGGVAAELHLEREGLDTAGNRIVSDLQCALDHQRLLELRSPVRLAFYYGPCDPLPWNVPTAHVAIDGMRAATRLLLQRAWPAVVALAEHLLVHGSADADVLDALHEAAFSEQEIHAILAAGMSGQTLPRIA